MALTYEQSLAIIRTATLLGGWAHVLAPFEAELAGEVVARFRVSPERMTLTDNEWRVIQEAVAAMTAARTETPDLRGAA
ncbi:hypothetical protein JIP62_06325 [Brevundimonas vitis]|uniref:Uncharacterized protein n=1 Tax=Brevundimonas vitisensis TaxID=2800818 RepID=A0ABX7BQ56_9CAUL|nr:hypothetical protein [Brevundimonas vitisensis]QQQ19700.1 hypothetical protein JIP62_06325 [Brevundimonas vitisensis]